MHKYTKQFTKHNCPMRDIVVLHTICHTQKTIFVMLRSTTDDEKIALPVVPRAEERHTPSQAQKGV